MVNSLELFRTNETLDDLSTSAIRFLTLPAFMGFFTSHIIEDRLCNLELAEGFYKEFFKHLKSYNIPDTESLPTNENDGTISSRKAPPAAGNNSGFSAEAAAAREAKIARYKRKRALEERLTELSKYVDQSHVDEEVKRDFNLTLVQNWSCIACDEVPALREEMRLLKYAPSAPMAVKEKRKPVKPFILTRDKVQAAVFGAGYPSLPTMTLDDFYEDQVRKGILPPPDTRSANSGGSGQGMRFAGRYDPSDKLAEEEEQKAAEDDAREDAHDMEVLQKQRNWDAFKDDHRRGSGNRMNRS